MGVQTLSKMIHSECNYGYKHTHLSALRGKKIAVDISIYLYRFKRCRQLIPDMFLLCSLFRENDISPIFVFDGQPPEHKNEVIEKRREKKKYVRDELEKLDKILNSSTLTIEERCKYEQERMYVDRMATHISKEDIENVQSLLSYYGMTWINSESEADVTCAWLCNNKYVWGVLSDDTDMFPLGCAFVIRNLNIINESCVVYDTYKILSELSMNIHDFRALCSLSKNDSNTNTNKNLIYDTYKSYKKNNKVYDSESSIDTSLYNVNCDSPTFQHDFIHNKTFDVMQLKYFLNDFNFY